ncbi:TetR/AcrR family transcriptional regulator [Rhizobium mongolense]
MFVRHGYESTSLGKIADAAGLSRVLVRSQFSGKDDILASVIRSGYIGEEYEGDDDQQPVTEWPERFFRIADGNGAMTDSWFELLSI